MMSTETVSEANKWNGCTYAFALCAVNARCTAVHSVCATVRFVLTLALGCTLWEFENRAEEEEKKSMNVAFGHLHSVKNVAVGENKNAQFVHRSGIRTKVNWLLCAFCSTKKMNSAKYPCHIDHFLLGDIDRR